MQNLNRLNLPALEQHHPFIHQLLALTNVICFKREPSYYLLWQQLSQLKMKCSRNGGSWKGDEAIMVKRKWDFLASGFIVGLIVYFGVPEGGGERERWNKMLQQSKTRKNFCQYTWSICWLCRWIWGTLWSSPLNIKALESFQYRVHTFISL